jgi:hypothetical protein
MKKALTAASMICALTIMAGGSWAAMLLVTNNTVPQSDVAPLGTAKPLDLSTAVGAQTSLNFTTTTANQLVRILFAAECAVPGNATNYVYINIQVDPPGTQGPTSCPPASGDYSLCAGNGTAASDGWAGAAVQCYIRIPLAGVSTVSVTADGAGASGATAGWRIDDLTLVIDTQ